MKILVDSSLTIKEPWFKTFPVFINGTLDENSLDKKFNKNNKTSYISFDLLKEINPIDENETTIIFTIPKSMSGQHQSYLQNNKHKNVHILEGTGFFTQPEQIKKILESDLSIESKKTEIEKINSSVKMNGYILDFDSLSTNGRLNSLFAKLFKGVNAKLKINWKDGKWKKDKLSLNGFTLIKKQIEEKECVNIICSTTKGKRVEKTINKIRENFPEKEINFKQMTNSMKAHSGNNFLVIY